MLQMLLGPLMSLGKQWLSNKAEEKQAKHEANLQRIQQESNWESIQAQGSLTSFKDEWWTVVLSLPIVALVYAIAFDNPDIIVRVHEAFDVLATLPEYYQYLLYVAVLASFGIRSVDKVIGMKK